MPDAVAAAPPSPSAAPAERTLPVGAGHREFTIKVDGQPVPRQHALHSVAVVAGANRIARARLTYVDGAAGAGDFPLSNLDIVKPGATVEILAGGDTDTALVFKGLIVGQRLRIRETSSSLLVIDCRHASTRLALVRRSANYFDQTDADAIESLLAAAGADGEVEATTVTHKQLVQHDCSDWDFIVTRASANGQLVFTRGGALAVRKPTIEAPVVQLQFGATLLEFDAAVDARDQAQAVKAVSWSAADQSLEEHEGEAPTFRSTGNFDAETLATDAGADTVTLVHAALDASEAAALASAARQRAAVDLAGGRAMCTGIAKVQPGDTVKLGGVGARFSGDVLVTGVRHDFDTLKGWKTHLQFGGVDPDPALRERLQRRRSADLLAPTAGLQVGVVTDNEDPDGEFRVRVRLPLVNGGDDGVWARVAAADAGDQRGLFFRPEIGDEVLLGFLDEDPRHPVVLGMLHSSAKAAPLRPSNDNHQKGYTSRSGIALTFDDGKKSLTLATPGGNTLVLDDDSGGITISDRNGNKITMSSQGIAIESATALSLKAKTEMKLDSVAGTDVKSAGVVKVAGSALQLG
ncbi:type VI secretion system tip protein VgrG [Variovorax sp. KK3]|uniref:type VI secretion system tip protein VgrG n=1 Tax=Variovorax sp. KK3 TaxID=1855728 RepID=UPI0009FB325D|nr:type VI secretion system tip protein VgrG [Variovorax sp. KK3]